MWVQVTKDEKEIVKKLYYWEAKANSFILKTIMIRVGCIIGIIAKSVFLVSSAWAQAWEVTYVGHPAFFGTGRFSVLNH